MPLGVLRRKGKNYLEPKSVTDYRLRTFGKFLLNLKNVNFDDVRKEIHVHDILGTWDLCPVIKAPDKDKWSQFFKLCEQKMEKLNGFQQDDVWQALLKAIFKFSPDTAFSIALECDIRGRRLQDVMSKSSKGGGLSKKDISLPCNFVHVDGSGTAAEKTMGKSREIPGESQYSTVTLKRFSSLLPLPEDDYAFHEQPPARPRSSSVVLDNCPFPASAPASNPATARSAKISKPSSRPIMPQPPGPPPPLPLSKASFTDNEDLSSLPPAPPTPPEYRLLHRLSSEYATPYALQARSSGAVPPNSDYSQPTRRTSGRCGGLETGSSPLPSPPPSPQSSQKGQANGLSPTATPPRAHSPVAMAACVAAGIMSAPFENSPSVPMTVDAAPVQETGNEVELRPFPSHQRDENHYSSMYFPPPPQDFMVDFYSNFEDATFPDMVDQVYFMSTTNTTKNNDRISIDLPPPPPPSNTKR